MHIVSFILYLALFSWLITRVPFFRKSGISPVILIGLFVFKVGAGCLYGWVHTFPPDYATTTDTWRFYYGGLKETQMLLSNPAAFFAELFHDPYNGGIKEVFSSSNSFWNDLKSNIMLKLAGIFNLFSFSHYYTNVIFFNFIGFFGPVAIYRTFQSRLIISAWLLIGGSFLIPSVLFWTSGFHKEGLLLTATGILFFYYNSLLGGKLRITALVIIAVCILVVFMLRNNVLFAILPALAGWWISNKYPARTLWSYSIIVAVCILLFFSSKYILPGIDLPQSVKERNEEFKALGGNTAVITDSIDAGPLGFLRYLPTAADLAMLRPHPGDGGGFYIPFTLEVIAGICLILLIAFFHKKDLENGPMRYFCYIYSILVLLLIGFTVSNVGAIVRYRSIVFPFLFIAMFSQIDWQKVLRRLHRIHN